MSKELTSPILVFDISSHLNLSPSPGPRRVGRGRNAVGGVGIRRPVNLGGDVYGNTNDDNNGTE